jgi:hypothetical protein
MSDMMVASAELLAQLQRLQVRLSPRCITIAADLSLLFLVAGLTLGSNIHTSIIALGNSLFLVGAVLTTVIWDIAGTLSLLVVVLEMSGAPKDVLANTLREYLHPTTCDPVRCPITTIDKLHSRFVDMLCRKCHMVLTLFPVLIAIAALQCCAIEQPPPGVIWLYLSTAVLNILISAPGFFTVRYQVRPMVADKLRDYIDPCLRRWLEYLEKDSLPASKDHRTFFGDVDDLDLEQWAPESCSLSKELGEMHESEIPYRLWQLD